ncbi:hypothetical protein G6F46_015055 [Rhizopus delemar]|nr:hypothetical protein G6F46_015055 [Rhizopus delemar]
MGGQTALNCALDLAAHGVLEKYNVELIGAKREAIRMAQDRELFRVAMGEIGLECPTAAVAHTLDEALEIQTRVAAAASPTTPKNSKPSAAAAWKLRRPANC